MAYMFTRKFVQKVLFIASVAIAAQPVRAQLDVVINDTQTPAELVQNVLLGAGVAVSNITVAGNIPATEVNQQFGEYIGPSDVVSFDRGFMMTTGNVIGAIGGDDFPNFTNNVLNDPDLFALSGQQMNNCAILEFDFIPNGDSLEFRYIFGSREYPSFTCSNFNDVFGFFISGPGITGPFTGNAKNIALIPNTTIPVGINTVNSGAASDDYDPDNCFSANPNWVEHSQYFVNNQPPALGDIEIPGLTTTLTAFASVICGQTYRIKLAIGNALDTGFQSYVFIESESFSSNSAVQVSLDIPVGINDSTLYRGCGEANLQFIRPLSSSGVQEVAYLDISGTAINGIDVFPLLPDSVIFPPGIDTVSFALFAPFLGNAVGQQTFVITITNVASECGGIELTNSFRFYINDAQPLAIEPGGAFQLADCNDEVALVPVVTGGYGNYKYAWSTGSTAESITASPGFTTNYFLTVSDTCNAGSVSTSFNVEVPVYPPVIVTMPDDILLEVCDVPIDVVPQVTGGFGAYTYSWRNMNNNQIISNQPVLNYIVESTTTLRLTVTDACGAVGIGEINITVPPVEVTVFLPDAYTATSCLETIVMPAISDGGIGMTTYSWRVDGELQLQSQNFFFQYHPSMGQEVVIRAEDECGNFAQDTAFVAFDFPAISLRTTPDTAICERTDALLRLQASEGSGNFRYEWLQNGQLTDTLRVAPRENSRYDYVVTDTCGVKVEGRIRVNIREVVASFEFDPIPYYGVQIRNQSRPLLNSTFEWDFGDGTTSREINPRHQFRDTEPFTIRLTTIDAAGCRDSTIRNTIPPAEVFIPSAFTPNGDGINELWKIDGANITEFEVWIYDRWGQLVYTSKDVNQGWNGSHMDGSHHNQMTLYTFMIRYKGKLEEDTFVRTGNIAVVR